MPSFKHTKQTSKNVADTTFNLAGLNLDLTFSDIYMIKMEKEALTPLKLKFYWRYVDGIINWQKENNADILFKRFNNYYQNTKFTIEISLIKFLDKKLISINGMYKTMVPTQSTKLPLRWSSKVPTPYKGNEIFDNLPRASRISTNFDAEVSCIIDKFQKVHHSSKISWNTSPNQQITRFIYYSTQFIQRTKTFDFDWNSLL